MRLTLALQTPPATPSERGDYLVRERFQRFPQIAHFTPERGFRHPATGSQMNVATWAGPIPPLNLGKEA